MALTTESSWAGPTSTRINRRSNKRRRFDLPFASDRVERGFKDGLLFRFAYTYSKAIDDVNSEVFVTSSGASRASNPFDRRADRSVASFDVPHRAVWSFIYDIPGPKRGFLGQVAGLWSVGGIYRLQSGSVESPFVGGIDLNKDLENFNDRPAIANPSAPPRSVAILASLLGASSPTGYVDANGTPVNPASVRYIVDPAIRTNIAGRNTLRGEITNTMDVSLNKGFRLPFEGHKLEVRFDFFNVFNHPNFTWAFLGADNSNGRRDEPVLQQRSVERRRNYRTSWNSGGPIRPNTSALQFLIFGFARRRIRASGPPLRRLAVNS